MPQVKIINTGVKAFARADTKGSDCVFRLAQEGALSTLPFVTKRVVRPDRADTVRILQVNCNRCKCLTNDMTAEF